MVSLLLAQATALGQSLQTDPLLAAIALLLPISAGLVVTQTNPYHALVMRGILGAVAALVYALLGAADVALTEALVGTMLSITLYAVAVRSSLTLRLGVITPDKLDPPPVLTPPETPALPEDLQGAIQTAITPHHLRMEVVCCDPGGIPIVPQPSLHVWYCPHTQTLFTAIESLQEILSPLTHTLPYKLVLTPPPAIATPAPEVTP